MSASIIEKKNVFVAGHRGMVGSAIVRTLLAQGVPLASIITRTHAELDLRARPLCKTSLLPSARARFIWRRQKWVAFTPITPTRPHLPLPRD
jgi:nucleoside-diphosphate-sugar epimerase